MGNKKVFIFLLLSFFFSAVTFGLNIRGISLSNITGGTTVYDFTINLMVTDTEGIAIEGATVTVDFESVISPNPNDYTGITNQYGIASISVTGVVNDSSMTYIAQKGSDSYGNSTTVDLSSGSGNPNEIHLSLLPGAPTTGYIILVDEKMHTVSSATEIEYTVGGTEAATVITSGDQIFPGGTAKIGIGNDADIGKEVDLKSVASPTINTSGETNKLRWGMPDHIDISVATNITYTTDVSTVSADLNSVSFKVTIKDENDNTVQEKLPIHWSASQILGSNLGTESGFGLSKASSVDAFTTVNGTNTASIVDFYIGGHAGDEFYISATETGDDISAHYSHFLEVVPGAPNKLLIGLKDPSQDVDATKTGWQVRADEKREDILNITPLNLKAVVADQHDNVITSYSTSSTVTWTVESNDSRTWLMEYVYVGSDTKTIHVSYAIDSIIGIYYYHDPQHPSIPATFSGTEITFTSTITCPLMVEYRVKNNDEVLLKDLFGGNNQSPITGYESEIEFYPTNYAGRENYKVKAVLGSWTGESTDVEILPYDYPIEDDPAAVVIQTADHKGLWTTEPHYPLQSDHYNFLTSLTSITLKHRAKTLVGVWKSYGNRTKIEYIPAHKAGATDESTKTIIIDEDLAKKYGSSSITLLVEYESDDASSNIIKLDHRVSAITLSGSTYYPVLDTEVTQGSTVIAVNSIDTDDRHKITLAQKVTGQVTVKYFRAEEVSADSHQTPLNVYVYDPHRNPIPDYSVEVRTRSNSLVTTLKTESNGKASYTLETNSVAETSYDLKAVVKDILGREISYDCDYIVVIPGKPAKFELSAITNTDSSTEVKANPDNTVELIAQLIDAYGNEIRGSSKAWDVYWSDSTGGGEITYRTELGHNLNYLGQSICDLTPSNTAGTTHTLHVSATTAGGSISEATPLAITVIPGDPYRVKKVVIIQGDSESKVATNVAEGEMVTLRAYIQDYNDNCVSSGYDVVWDFTPYGRGARFAGTDPDTSKITQTASNGTSDVDFYVSRLVGDEFMVTATIEPPDAYGTVTSTATSPMITVIQGAVKEVDIGLLATETVHTATTDHIDLSRNIVGVMGVWATDTSEATNYYVYCNGDFRDKRITFSESIPAATYTVAYLYRPDMGKTYEVSADSPSTAVYVVVRDGGKNGVNGTSIQLTLSDADSNPNDPYHISRSLWNKQASLSATNIVSGVYPFGNHSVNGIGQVTLNTTVFAGDNYEITAKASDISTTSSVFTVIAGSQDHIFLYSTDVGNITLDVYGIMQREHHTVVSSRIVLEHYANVEFTDKNDIVKKRIVVIGDDGKNYFKSIKSDGKTVDLKEDAPSSVTAYYFPAPELDAGEEIMLVARNEDMYGNSTDSTACTATFVASPTNINNPRSDPYLQLRTTTIVSTSTLTLDVAKTVQLWFRAKEADDPDPDIMIKYLNKQQKCHLIIFPGLPTTLSMSVDKTSVSADDRKVVARTSLVDEFGNTVEKDFPVIWSYEEVSSGARTPGVSDLSASFALTSTVDSTITYASNGIATTNFYTSTVAGAEFRITATASTIDKPSTDSSLVVVKPGEVKYIAIEGESPNLSIHAGDITSPSITDKTPYLGGIYCYTEDKYKNEISNTAAEKSVNLSAGVRFAPREDNGGNTIYRRITNEEFTTPTPTNIVYTHFTIVSTPAVKDNSGKEITVVSYSSNRIILDASVTGVYITYDAGITNLLPPSGDAEIDGLGQTTIRGRLPDRKEVEGDRGRGYIFFSYRVAGTAEISVGTDDPTLQVDPEASCVVVTVLPGEPDLIRIFPAGEREEKLGEFNVGEATEIAMTVQVKDANGNSINGGLTSVPVTFSLVGEVRDEYLRSKSATSIEVKYPISSKFGLISIYVASSEYGTPSYNYAASATFSGNEINLTTPLATADAPLYVSYYTDISEGGIGFASDPGGIRTERTVYADESGRATIDYVKFGVHTDVQNDIIAYIKDGLANEDHYVKFYATLKTTQPSRIEIVPTDRLASADVGKEKYLMVYIEDDYGNVVTNYTGDVTFTIDKAGIVKGGPTISVIDGKKEVKFIGYEHSRYSITAVASPGDYETERPLYLQVSDNIPPTYVKTAPEDGTAFNENRDDVFVYLSDEGAGIDPGGCVIHVYKETSTGTEIDLDSYGSFNHLLETITEKPMIYGTHELVLSNYIAPGESATLISATGTHVISGISGRRIITLDSTITADASISVQYNTLVGLKWKINGTRGFEQPDLGEGIYEVTIDQIKDEARNTLSDAGTSTFAYDTTSPSPVTVSSIVMGENDEIYVPGKFNYVISENALKFGGKAELGSEVIADVKTQTAEATFGTNAGYLPRGIVYQYTKESTSFELSITLPDATVRATVTLTSMDSAGNISEPVNFNFIVDKIGPVIFDVNYPTEVLKNSEIMISAKVTDANSGIKKVELLHKHLDNRVTEVSTIATLDENHATLRLSHGVETIESITQGATDLYAKMTYGDEHLWKIDDTTVVVKIEDLKKYSVTVGSTVTIVYDYVDERDIIKSGDSDIYKHTLPASLVTEDVYFKIRAEDEGGNVTFYPGESAYEHIVVKASTSVTVDPAKGGKISISNVTVDIPPDAMYNKEVITIRIPSIERKGGKVYVVSDGKKIDVTAPGVKIGTTSATITPICVFADLMRGSSKGKVYHRVFRKPVTITVGYPDDDNDGFVDGTEVNENNLKLFFYDGYDWVYVNSSVDAAANTVTGRVTHFTLFGIFAVDIPAPDSSKPLVTDIKLEGNPLNPNEFGMTIRYTVTRPAKVRMEIYNSAGTLMNILRGDDTFTEPGFYSTAWYGDNRFGDKVPSGAYILLLRAQSESGDVMLERRLIVIYY